LESPDGPGFYFVNVFFNVPTSSRPANIAARFSTSFALCCPRNFFPEDACRWIISGPRGATSTWSKWRPETLIAYRGAKTFVILNRFPYTSGHVMIVPYAHVAELSSCDAGTLGEMMNLAQRAEKAFQANYKPDGMNLGMNLGRAAGAGIAGHLHLHVLPRWFGDANFMTVTGETRVHPEDLKDTYQRLRKALA
jgi:ATP adenylyltransferase